MSGLNEVQEKAENPIVTEEGTRESAAVKPAAEALPQKKEEGGSGNADTKETKLLKSRFGFFGPASLLYAVFYAFCMYKNRSGVTFPFFMAGSLLFFCFSIAKLGRTLKKGSAFYMVVMMLLAISTFLTDDARIIAFNQLGILLLMLSLLLKQFCNTEKWGLGKYFSSIVTLVLTSIGELSRPFRDAAAYVKEHSGEEKKNIYYVLLGLCLAVPLLLVVLALLSSADAVFRQITDGILKVINMDNVIGIVVQIAVMFLASYALLANLCKGGLRDEVKDHRSGEPVLAITITSLLTLVYLLFSGIQIFGLFLGQLRLPEGYTYAEYAREGFFQLLAVSALNLVIVLFCMAFFRESRILKTILTVMSFCTFVMIAASAMRMIIYIRYYYLTFLRILVLWSLALLFLLFAGVVVNIFREEFKLFQYGVTVVSVFYLLLSFSHPDYLIARVNIANAPQSMETAMAYYHGEGGALEALPGDFFQSTLPYKDYRYLSTLSMDAAPVVIPYLEKLGYWENYHLFVDEPEEYQQRPDLFGIYNRGSGRNKPETFGIYYLERLEESTEGLGVRTFNVSRYVALQLAQQRGK